MAAHGCSGVKHRCRAQMPGGAGAHFLHNSLMAFGPVAVMRPSRYGSSMYS
jgi:hypothetical protein